MNFYIDTEFYENGNSVPIKLISIGVACENGHSIYMENEEYDLTTADEWTRQNILPGLMDRRASRSEMVKVITDFVEQESETEQPEFWGYYSSYDWVLFCQIFGTMLKLPKRWPKRCNDLAQLASSLGVSKSTFPSKPKLQHNAMHDALWNMELHKLLMTQPKTKEMNFGDLGPLPVENNDDCAIAQANKTMSDVICRLSEAYKLTSTQLMSVLTKQASDFMVRLVAIENRSR